MIISDLRARLASVLASILGYRIPNSNPPVIDHDSPDGTDVLPGLRCLRDEVKRDCDVLDKQLIHEPASSVLPSSTNAPYLIAVWDELVHARRPVAIYRTFYPTDHRGKPGTARANGKRQVRAVKVDVVAENGTRWARVNTIKNARLMMEFCEMDSYLTSDDEVDGDEPRPRLAQTEFDNSVLRMGRELLAAAKANPVSTPAPDPTQSLMTITPQITIRLTRLDPLNSTDPRIEKTIQCLCDMGINVQLGERSHPLSPPISETAMKPKLLQPTTNINLDLSALIALISDISHSPLPRTEQDACARFDPPQHYLEWKKNRVKSLAQGTRHFDQGADGDGDENTWENPRQHSRALAEQAIREMSRGILKEIHELKSSAASRLSIPLTNVTFWTTSEARHRCLEIVSRIGGERERKRADALLGSTRCARTLPVPAPTHIVDGTLRTASVMEVKGAEPPDAYWEHSRYPAEFLPLVPVRVYPSILPTGEDRQQKPAFFDALARTCTQILSHGDSTSSPPSPPDPSPTSEQALDEIPPAPQTVLPKLTVHTVRSMLAGASRGCTTLTTNKSSVKAVLKETRRVCGAFEPDLVGGDVEEAVLWVLGPRSLSEGMRSE